MRGSPHCLLYGLLLLALSACDSKHSSPAPSATPEQVSEADWAANLERVRRGESHSLLLEDRTLAPEQFAQLQEDCAGLTRLEIDQSSIGDDLLARVLPALPNLERLKLSGAVSDAALSAIARLPKLEILNLPAGEFGDAGLASLAGHPSLNFLRFHSPHVTDQGLAVLPQIPRLRFLHLINVPMTDAGLPQMYELKKLESFYLDGGNCTEDGLSKLIQHLPELHFHWNQLHLPGDPQADP
jgi:hypothetical protein